MVKSWQVLADVPDLRSQVDNLEIIYTYSLNKEIPFSDLKNIFISATDRIKFLNFCSFENKTHGINYHYNGAEDNFRFFVHINEEIYDVLINGDIPIEVVTTIRNSPINNLYYKLYC